MVLFGLKKTNYQKLPKPKGAADVKNRNLELRNRQQKQFCHPRRSPKRGKIHICSFVLRVFESQKVTPEGRRRDTVNKIHCIQFKIYSSLSHKAIPRFELGIKDLQSCALYLSGQKSSKVVELSEAKFNK